MVLVQLFRWSQFQWYWTSCPLCTLQRSTALIFLFPPTKRSGKAVWVMLSRCFPTLFFGRLFGALADMLIRSEAVDQIKNAIMLHSLISAASKWIQVLQSIISRSNAQFRAYWPHLSPAKYCSCGNIILRSKYCRRRRLFAFNTKFDILTKFLPSPVLSESFVFGTHLACSPVVPSSPNIDILSLVQETAPRLGRPVGSSLSWRSVPRLPVQPSVTQSVMIASYHDGSCVGGAAAGTALTLFFIVCYAVLLVLKTWPHF